MQYSRRYMFLASACSFSHLSSVFLHRFIHFVGTVGDKLKGRSRHELNSFIQVHHIVHANVHVFSLNIALPSSPQRVLTPIYPFRKDLGGKVKGSSPKKLKKLIEVPYVCQLKVHVFTFNVILLSSPQRDPRPSYPFRRNFGRSGKGLSPKKLINL